MCTLRNNKLTFRESQGYNRKTDITSLLLRMLPHKHGLANFLRNVMIVNITVHQLLLVLSCGDVWV